MYVIWNIYLASIYGKATSGLTRCIFRTEFVQGGEVQEGVVFEVGIQVANEAAVGFSSLWGFTGNSMNAFPVGLLQLLGHLSLQKLA